MRELAMRRGGVGRGAPEAAVSAVVGASQTFFAAAAQGCEGVVVQAFGVSRTARSPDPVWLALAVRRITIQAIMIDGWREDH